MIHHKPLQLHDRDGQIAKLNKVIIDQVSHIKTLSEEIAATVPKAIEMTLKELDKKNYKSS